MSSVVIAGDTSGTVTLDAPAVAGSTVLTLPATSGAVLTNTGALGVSTSAPADSFVVDASGNVGIGASSPTQAGLVITKIGANESTSAKLAIKSNNTSADTYLRIGRFGTANDSALLIGNNYNRDDGFSADDSSYGVTSVGFDNGFLSLNTGAAGQTNPTERMRITSAGEVWIAGTTDRGAFNLQCNGTGVWGAGAYTNGSDARIKDDITPLDSGLDVVEKLNPVTYKYKEDWSKDQSIQTGFIAQDLLVALEGKEYVDGIVNQSSEYMSVAYQNIIPILTKAIQELNAKVEAQAEQIKALQGAA
jgi:hypothetical protein